MPAVQVPSAGWLSGDLIERASDRRTGLAARLKALTLRLNDRAQAAVDQPRALMSPQPVRP
jgi:hypothetical protein